MKWSRVRVLVTGAAGFIGTHLVMKLIEHNAEVIALDNFSIGKKQNLKFFNGEIIKADVTNRNLLSMIKGDLDYIFHFGAPSSVILFNENPSKCFNETCGGFLNIIKLAKEKTVKKIVYPSSGSVYGRTTPPQSEKDTPRPVNLYGIAKLTCEKIAELYLNDVKLVGLRIFAGYGPGENHKGRIASPVTLFLNSIIANERPIVYGDGKQRRDFVYIDDIIKAIIRSAERETPPIINVGSGRSYTFNKVIAMINELLGKNIKPKYVPKPVNYLERTEADITLMKSTLDIIPLTLEEGLKEYLNHVKSERL